MRLLTIRAAARQRTVASGRAFTPISDRIRERVWRSRQKARQAGICVRGIDAERPNPFRAFDAVNDSF